MKKEFSKVEEDKIIDEKDIQLYNKLLKNFDEYSKEISRNTTYDGSISLNNKSIINISIKENKELSDKMFKESKYIQNKYLINKFNNTYRLTVFRLSLKAVLKINLLSVPPNIIKLSPY